MNPDRAPGDGLRLAFGLSFESLYLRDGLVRLDAHFTDWLAQREPELASRLLAARAAPPASALETATLLIDVARWIDPFVALLFGIEADIEALGARHADVDPLLRVKWKFVKRRAVLGTDPAEIEALDAGAAARQLKAAGADPDDEPAFARAVLDWQARARSDPRADERLTLARRYAAWAATTPAGRRRHGRGILFSLPGPVEPDALLDDVHGAHSDGMRIQRIRPESIRPRTGFGLSDPGPSLADAVDEARYCLQCHRHGNDSCSHGLPARETGGGFARSAHGVALSGCPLEERISEFLTLKREGAAIGALAMITLDNPMVAVTGHRICNECSKACIFQQQTPVDIPAAETRVLRDVLELRWGFEVYGLLTRWNPLSLRQPVPAASSGRNVLVVGAGPAGFTLAHHLLQAGHGVALVDGLRIEPLPPALGGSDPDGRGRPFEPVERVEALAEPLDRRIAAGFGGVAEYGITTRWDKNFLLLTRMLLERRERLRLHGSVRFGGSLDFDAAWSMGFDHVALATGAGRPRIPPLPHALAPGVRLASDFLMALQLTGAARDDSLANLQVRLPVVVIGGGLTAIDTATEALAYYPVQVERFAARHRAIVAACGEAGARAGWTESDRALADEFLGHAQALADERERAAREGRPARIAECLAAWGGVTVAYRRRLTDSPAYRLNHEELQAALEQGVCVVESFEPRAFDVDRHGAVEALRGSTAECADARIPAGSVFIAIGTQPNTSLVDDCPDVLSLDGEHLAALDEDGHPGRPPAGEPKAVDPPMLVWRDADARAVTHFGDLHPSFAGSVVRAMASARRGAPLVGRWLERRRTPPVPFDTIAASLAARLDTRVVRVERLAPRIVEIVISAPAAARAFAPGQFFRLQNFETLAPVAGAGGLPTRLGVEALALTGAWADPQRGLLGTIVLESGASSRLAGRLAAGEPVSLMGPTGAPTEIPGDETVMLVGGGLGNAVLFSIGRALREAGSRVVYFAAYREPADRFRPDDIEAASDAVVWCCEQAPGLQPRRPQDRAFVGSVTAAIDAAIAGGLDALSPAPADCDRLLTIGSDRMMAAVAHACATRWRAALKPGIRTIASVNSPMQCMLKAICAQCVQSQTDPQSGETRFVFSCRQQDQPLAAVDFDVLAGRLGQNALLEKQASSWLQLCVRARPEGPNGPS